MKKCRILSDVDSESESVTSLMTTLTTTRKICTFLFTRLDRSRLTNLDRSTSSSDVFLVWCQQWCRQEAEVWEEKLRGSGRRKSPFTFMNAYRPFYPSYIMFVIRFSTSSHISDFWSLWSLPYSSHWICANLRIESRAGVEGGSCYGSANSETLPENIAG